MQLLLRTRRMFLGMRSRRQHHRSLRLLPHDGVGNRISYITVASGHVLRTSIGLVLAEDLDGLPIALRFKWVVITVISVQHPG